MNLRRSLVIGMLLATAVLAACGPGARNGGGNGSDVDGAVNCNGTPSAENTPETCSDGIDNNCNGLIDCADPSCSGIGSCPVCGMAEHPVSSPLVLPDGACGDATHTSCTCTTDADCAALLPAGQQHCFDIQDGLGGHECRLSYISKLHFMGFGATQKFAAVSNIQSVCVNIAHSWMRDLDIQLVAPSGQIVELDKFGGRTGGEIYFGMAYDVEDCGTSTNVGVGADYCWTPTAVKPAMLTYAGTGTMNSVATCSGGTTQEMPPDKYSASDPWLNLIGADLNGDWQLRVTDLWPIDEGYVFKWSIQFDPSIVQDCSGPIVQ